MNTGTEICPRKNFIVGVILLVPSLKIVLIRSNEGDGPQIKNLAGKVKKYPEETPIEALYRTTKKKTGIDLSLNKVDWLLRFLPKKKRRYDVYSCIISDPTGMYEQKVRDRCDTYEVVIVDPNEASEMMTMGEHKTMFHLAINEMYKLL